MITYYLLRASINIFEPPYTIGSVPILWGHAIAYRWRSLRRVCRYRASKPQGSSKRVVPWQVTMEHQLICASLSHTTIGMKCVYVFIKLHITAQSGPVILVILCQCMCLCMLSSHLFWMSDYLWTYQPGSRSRKVAHDFSTFLLRCLPPFLS